MGKSKLKRSLVVCLSLCLSVCCAILGVHISEENELDKIQKVALETLNEDIGTYDESTIVLNSTDRATAESLANKLGAKLRITKDGSYATLTLRNGMTVRDVYEDKENRALLGKFSLDYYSETSDIEEQETVRQTTAPKYTVSDSLYSYQSYLNYLHIENTWEKYRGSGVTVAVIDTGIDTDHPEFSGKISEYSYNATDDKIVKDYTLEDGSYNWSLIEDAQGHGTSVAGVIAAGMNGEGVVGIAPEVTLLIIKVDCDENGSFYRTSDLVFGLYYAIERDADVVNMSFGSNSNSFVAPALLANDSDVTLVAAAGNDSSSALTYPAADENVIGVGALEDGGWNLATYSNFGDNTDVVAPGTVYTTAIGGGYRTISGTSFASPVTAAAVALLKSQNKNIENEKVKELLYASSSDLGGLGKDFYYGYGALDISALIMEKRGTVTFDMLTDELEDIEQVFIRNHTLQNIPEPDRNYAVFDGWYYDIHCTEELNLYADVWTSDLTLYANWVNEDDGVPYTYVILDDDTVEIRSYTGHRRYITIPEKIEGKTVSSIGDFAFDGQSRLRQVNLPHELKKIGMSAFADCSDLLSVSIPDGVEEIGMNAFANDSRLHTVAFGQNSSLKTVGNFAFRNCGLTNFELPVSVESVNGSAFVGCSSLANFSVRKGNNFFVATNGVLYSKTKSTLAAFPAGKNSGAYTLPDQTVTVGEYAFAYARIRTIDLKNAQTICGSAFMGSKLTALTVPDSVASLGDEAFAYNFDLRSLTIGKGLTTISSGAFKMAYSLVEVKIPKTVRYINGGASGGAFEKCLSLASVTFEENSNLLSIGSSAFESCNLKQIEIPKNVVTIGAGAFEKNYDLSELSFEAGSVLRLIDERAFIKTHSLTSVTLPENLSEIGAFAFMESGLTEVTLPKTVTKLGAGAFASCHSLENVFVESGNGNYDDIDGVVYSKDRTVVVEYPAGKDLTKYTVAAGVKIIGECAFYGAWNLNAVSLPDGVATVGEYAFYDCENATSYSLPETLTAIERYAFSENASLGYINIPDSVIQISNYAFAFDYSLSTIGLSDSSELPRISFAAFAYTGITSMRIPANVSSIAQYAFTGSDKLKTVTFAANSKLDIVPAYMFRGANSISGITFENGSALKSIAAHGFEGMTALTSVDFGNAKLTNIDNYAFRYCESLQTVNVPDGVTGIGRFAFYGCKSLTSLNLPDSIDHIGRFAFYFAEKLNVYFKADVLPANLQENWDYGIAGYYVGVTDVLENGDWKYATLTNGGVSIIKYTGAETVLDLTALDLGGDIRQIGGYAFAYSKITGVTLPETLESIQRYAFAYSKLENIEIPAYTSFIGQFAFFNTPLKTAVFEENSSLLKIEQYAFAYTGDLKEIVIPNSVEEMQSYAFYRSGIEKVTFEQGTKLTEIAAHAFASSGLLSVTVPDSVNYVDDNAFRDCLSLQTVTFGAAENLQVHANAFYNTAISSLYIPANMEYVGEYAFIGLTNLEEYVVADDNPRYTSINGVLYDKDGKKLIAFPAGKTGAFEVPRTVETIGFGAFENTKIESVSFEDGINLLTLGYRAFYNAKNLTSVSIPASVVSIDYYAFAECRNLETVAFAEDNMLTGIYEGAFLNCLSLANVVLPDSIVEISDYAFYGCSSLMKLPFSATATVKGIYDYAFAYTGIRELVVPDSVTDIGAYAFRGARVKTVVIPDTQKDVLIIGIGALQDCDELEELNIPFSGASLAEGETCVWFGYVFGAGSSSANGAYMPQSLRKISVKEVVKDWWGSSIFDGTYDSSTGYNWLSHVEYLELPKGLTYIGNSAFRNCSGLKSVTIPDNVTSIGNSAFFDCSSLTSITIPDCVTEIGDYAFKNCSSLTSITIPEGVTSIEWMAFDGCSSLTSITIPESVTSIGNYAFYKCSSLTSITLPESAINIGDSAFYGCKSLKSIVIPEGVTSIGELTFWGCSSLTNVTLPESVTSIEWMAFDGCRSLTSITIPESVTSIGSSAFSGCSSLTSITIPESVTSIGGGAFSTCINLTSITIPESVTSIGGGAFRDCRGLTSITISASVTTIGDSAFEQCERLYQITNNSDLQFTIGSEDYGKIAYYAKVIIDKDGNKTYKGDYDGFTYIDTADGFRFMQEKANAPYKLVAYLGQDETVTLPLAINGQEYEIYMMRGVKNVILPDGMTKIGDNAFYDCDSLISITIPESVTNIGDSAFYRCSSLTNITIPNSVTSIGSGAFRDCSSLTRVTISKNVTSISGRAFYRCSSLTSITIPEIVTSIGGSAFEGCSSLTSITISKNVTSIGGNAFAGCDKLSLTIDDENPNFTSIDNVIYNKAVTQIVYVLPNVTDFVAPKTLQSTVGFKDNTKIFSVDLSSAINLSSIEYGEFSGCSSLTSVIIPENVTSIGENAFFNCISLTSIEIPKGIKSISRNTFSGCSSLTSITIPESVTSIGSSAFSGCSSLTSITIPESVTSI